MKRCLFLIAMAITLPSLAGCIIDPHRPYGYYHDRDRHCDGYRDSDCHRWR